MQRFDDSAGLLLSSSLAVFRVDLDAGFVPLGEIEQLGLVSTTFGELGQWDGAQCASVRRSVMISDDVDGGFVYAVSTAGVIAAAIEDGLPTMATVRIASQSEQPCDFAGSPL